MTDPFKPRLVQVEYLHQAGFRDTIVLLLRDATAHYSIDYEWSEENERRRMSAQIALEQICHAVEHNFTGWDPTHTGADKQSWIYYSNRILVGLHLAADITTKDCP